VSAILDDADAFRARLEWLHPATLRLAGARTYSGPFSHALDTTLDWAYLRGALARAYPAMRAFAARDALAPWIAGYALVATAERTGA